jgi:type IV pilus assembly protein PilA
MKKNTSNKGFTLIEILVVIGIIAILAAIVIIAINPARQFAQARNSQRTSNVNAILNGVGQYVSDNKGVLPAAVTAAVQNVADTGANLCATLVPTYMPALVVDPVQDPDGAGALAQGQAVPTASCGATYDTAYTIIKDAVGRVTVCAPNGVEAAIPGSTAICVTR